MAVEVGFEPTDRLPHHTLSRRAPSATRRLHRGAAYRITAQSRTGGEESVSSAAHSSASTPVTTSGRWLSRRSLTTSQSEPDGPALGVDGAVDDAVDPGQHRRRPRTSCRAPG